MTTAYEIKVILLQKLSNYISSESTGDSSVTVRPPFDLRIRIRPKKIAEKTVIRDFGRPSNIVYLIQLLQLRRQPSMHTKYLPINKYSYRQTVEAICEYSPKPNVKPSFTLIIKPIVLKPSNAPLPPKKEKTKLVKKRNWIL